MDLLQGLKAVLTNALVSEGAVKALDVSVLRWAARLDQDVLDAMLMSPHPEPLTGELQSVIDFDRLGGGQSVAALSSRFVTYAPPKPKSAVVSMHSPVKSSATVRHLIRRDAAPRW